MLLRLADGSTPMLFHCAAGKDRTGIGAALVLSLLGVSKQQIIEDYLLTQHEISNKIEGWMAGGASDDHLYQDFQLLLEGKSEDVIKSIFDADLSYINHLFDYLEAEYGSFTSYAVQQLEISTDQIDNLKKNLLTNLS